MKKPGSSGNSVWRRLTANCESSPGTAPSTRRWPEIVKEGCGTSLMPSTSEATTLISCCAVSACVPDSVAIFMTYEPGSDAADFELAVGTDLAGICPHRIAGLREQLDSRLLPGRDAGHDAADAIGSLRHESEIDGDLITGIDRDRRTLRWVVGSGIVGCEIASVRRGVARSGFFRLLFVVTEVGRRHGQNRILAGKQAGETVFAEIVGVAAGNRFARCFAGLFAECDDSRPGHGIAVFVGDAAGDGGCGQYAEELVFHRLSGFNGDYIDVRLAALAIDSDESGSLDEDTITAGCDVLDAEMAVGVG